jgi:hypothetical protein
LLVVSETSSVDREPALVLCVGLEPIFTLVGAQGRMARSPTLVGLNGAPPMQVPLSSIWNTLSFPSWFRLSHHQGAFSFPRTSPKSLGERHVPGSIPLIQNVRSEA